MNWSNMRWSRRTWQTSWQRKHSMHLRNSWTRSTSTCDIRQVPSAASGGLGLNRLTLFFARKFQDTSATRSRISGKLRIGSTVTGWDRSSSLGLDLVHGVEHDHALGDVARIVFEFSTVAVAAPDPERRCGHHLFHLLDD